MGKDILVHEGLLRPLNQPIAQRMPESYLLTGIVSEEGEFVVARAMQAAGRRQALLKVAAACDPARGTLPRLEREFELTRSLGSAFVVRPLTLARPDHETALVMEHPGGQFLGEVLGAPVAIPRFLTLAIDIALALADLHECDLVHRDIRPANILVDVPGGGARLTGLGFAVVTRVPYQGNLNLGDDLAGTLPNMAPEQTGRPLEFEEVATEADGLHSYIAIKAPLRDAAGEIYATCGISTDITERKRAVEERSRLEISEQAARAEAASARELDRLRAQFISSIFHELRTPLTSIRGYLEFLEDDMAGPLTPEQRDFVIQVGREAARLESLIADLLDAARIDAARIDAGTFRLQVANLDFAGLVQEVAASFRPQIQEAQLTLSVATPGGRVPVMGDEQRLVQVFWFTLPEAGPGTDAPDQGA